MSRTKRKDSLDHAAKTGDIVILGATCAMKPTPAELAKAHRDGKPYYKPGRKAKRYLQKGRKARTRKALARVVEDPDGAVLPREPKTDVWTYN